MVGGKGPEPRIRRAHRDVGSAGATAARERGAIKAGQELSYKFGYWGSIPDDAPPALKNGLGIRNRATATGTCPACGATAEIAGPIQPGRVTHVYMGHDGGCPALLELTSERDNR